MVAACGTEEGTLLTVRAPDGPDNVARLEIVLANADPATITELDQRASPAMLAGETARYYRQRATAGVIENVGAADGFTVRIESNIAMVPEKTFIPFLVAYDAQENVVGIGAVLDVAGEPSTVNIEPHGTVQYIVDMVALKPMDPALGMGERESMHVTCGDAKWTSGIAWRPATTQLRLLLGADGPDATERDADLDCDTYVAGRGDCDDLRSTFNPGMPEQCDGFDSNCDAARTTVQSCNGTQCSGGGVQLCDDRTGEPIGACVASADCACTQGGACNQCSLFYRATANATRAEPCAPGVGKMHFPSCATDGAPCTIEVLANAPWTGYIGPSQTGPFGTKAQVTAGYAYLEIKLTGASDVERDGSIGSVNLVITQSGQSHVLPVALYLAEEPAVTTCPQIGTSGTYVMSCSPEGEGPGVRDVGGPVLGIGVAPPSAPPELRAQRDAGDWGATILFKRNLTFSTVAGPTPLEVCDLDALVALNRELHRSAPDGTPALIAVDQEGGLVQRMRAPATHWPPMRAHDGFAPPDDAQLAEQVGLALGRELRAVGFDIDFAPVLDIHTNPANPIIGDRAFGTEPEAVARRALAFARGLDAAGVLACGKHFPGHGDTATDSHHELPRIDHAMERLERVELVPFARAAAAKLPMIMTAHVVFAALDPRPATMSERVIGGLLRDKLGYTGVIVSDDLDMRAVADRMTSAEAAVGAIRAGCDVLLLCRDERRRDEARDALIREGERDSELRRRIGESAARVREMKRAHAANQQRVAAPARDIVGSFDHKKLADRLAGR